MTAKSVSRSLANAGAPRAAPVPSRRAVALAGAVIALATFAAYYNTLSAPFIFDDEPAIVQNESIRKLWPLWSAMSPPPGASGAIGRPVVNLTLALNYALGGTDVRGYHGFNLALHGLAALALFGVARRTLRLPALRARFGDTAWPWAAAIALVWAVHPLQTESVTCVIQRSELLGGLFYLLTLYCFIRGVEAQETCGPLAAAPPAPTGGAMPAAAKHWFALSVAACLVGMASKEFMISAPFLVWLYDRTFVAGGFREAWRRRRGVLLALGATWLVLDAVMLTGLGRGGTVGFGYGVAWWEYALTQCRAVTLYLRLAFWPHPLVLDYGTAVVRSPWEVWWQGLLVLLLLGATTWAVLRKPMSGFLCVWFFAILAPSSSVVPLVTQTMAEHRMYLPLAAVIALVAAGLHAVAGRRAVWWLAVLAAPLGFATAQRNATYATAVGIWADSVARWPHNPRAQEDLAMALARAGRLDEAITRYQELFRLYPEYARGHYNLGNDLLAAGRIEAAVPAYQEALRLQPGFLDARINLGITSVRLGRLPEAIAQFETVLRQTPDSAYANFNLGQAYAQAGRISEAIPLCARAVWLMPEMAQGYHLLGNTLTKAGRTTEALTAYRSAVLLAPDDFEATMNLAGTLLTLGRAAEAAPVYEAALRLRPDHPLARQNLALARRTAGLQ